MLKAYTAYTHEIDDVKGAVADIMQQLNLVEKLRKNSVGIITCYAEYIESGVVQALCSNLPFDVVGVTSIANATADQIGETMLTLMVLTSDEYNFAAGLSEALVGENENVLRNVYENTQMTRLGKPSLILSFAPLLFNVGSNFYVECMEDISGGVPNFGTLAVDHNDDYCDSQVIFNGEGWHDRYVCILVYGEVSPEFYIGTISDKRVFQENGVVTASKANQLQEINDISMIDYLLSLGLEQNAAGDIVGLNTFPIIVDYNDGTPPVVRAMFALTPEGYAVCSGDVPVGATISIGAFDAAEIKETTALSLEKALENKEHNVCFMYSCIGRYFALGANQEDEMECIKQQMQQANIPYFFAYSGGEICPVYTGHGELLNRDHSNTFVLCAL